MFQKIVLILTVLLFTSCVKKQLKETNLSITSPISQQTFHKGDTVFISGNISYTKEIKNIGFFMAMTDTLGIDSTFFQRTVLPLENPYKIEEYYVNDFPSSDNIIFTYAKRNVKTGQIYEIKELKLKFVP